MQDKEASSCVVPVLPFFVREGPERQDDIKEVAKSIIGGAWLDVPNEDITATTIGGGITNLLFKLEGPVGETPILIRIYGHDTDVLIDRERDNALFNELATMGYAPPFHGRFSNGRIEGFLRARPLKPEEMAQRTPVDFVSLIAREMARLHRFLVTTAGPPGEAEIWRVLPKWLQLAKGMSFEHDNGKASAVAALDLDWMCGEAEWLEQRLRPSHQSHDCSADGIDAGTMNQEPRATLASDGQENVEQRANRFLSEVVLCHNDLLSGNVLYATGSDRVQVIDFEYSGYNHRGFDIANHFCEHAGFDSNFAKSYPTADTQAAFLVAYYHAAVSATPTRNASNVDTKDAQETTGSGVGESVAATGGGPQTPSPGSEEEAFIEALRKEVNRWTLPSHLWWAAWAIIQARHSPIDFDFLDYARLRLVGYRLHKEAFFESPAGDT